MKASGKAIIPTLAVVAITALGLSQTDNLTNTSSQNTIIQNVIKSEINSTNGENLIGNIVEIKVENNDNTITNKNIENTTSIAETNKFEKNKVESETVEQHVVEKTPAESNNSSSTTNKTPSTATTSHSNTSSTTTIPTSTTYILNTNSKKFHKPSCASVKKMKESNKETFTGSRDDVISRGYQPCKNCNP